jgi:hypothetical protein
MPWNYGSTSGLAHWWGQSSHYPIIFQKSLMHVLWGTCKPKPYIIYNGHCSMIGNDMYNALISVHKIFLWLILVVFSLNVLNYDFVLRKQLQDANLLQLYKTFLDLIKIRFWFFWPRMVPEIAYVMSSHVMLKLWPIEHTQAYRNQWKLLESHCLTLSESQFLWLKGFFGKRENGAESEWRMLWPFNKTWQVWAKAVVMEREEGSDWGEFAS